MVAACIAGAAEAVQSRCDASRGGTMSKKQKKHQKTSYGGFHRGHDRLVGNFPDKKRRICKKCGIIFEWKSEGWNALMGRPEAHLARNWNNRLCRRCNIVRYYQQPAYVPPDAWKVKRRPPKWQEYEVHFHQYDIYKG